VSRPRLLDLYCCAGGAGMGYHRAGFDVTGVDLAPQPRYPFTFHQADAVDYLLAHWADFDAVHASPPCQRHSAMSNCRPGLAGTYPDLVAATRAALDWTGLPYIIENVVGAPLRPDVVLCGQMFGRALYRHRVFESNIPLSAPSHPVHVLPASRAGHWTPGTIISIAGNVAPMKLAREVMDMDWTNRRELAESIPPYYTEHLGAQLLAALGEEKAA
jgi:DNA (cytosine-5)-methyltransferase 1